MKKVVTVDGLKVVRELTVGYRTNESGQNLKHLDKQISSPEDLVDMTHGLFYGCPWERFASIYLDGRNKVITWRMEAEGTPSQACPHVRNIMTNALLSSASGMAVVHNHPSGATSPSSEDRKFTSALKSACDTMEIQFLDHLIVGGDSFYSFSEMGNL